MDTTHKFNPSKLNQTLCAVCYRTEELHGKVECESCSRVASLTNVNGMWICQLCLDKELEVVVSSPTSQVEIQSTPITIANEINTDHRPTEIQNQSINKLGSQAISRSEEFFNARTIAIADRWKSIQLDETINAENKHYELAREVREHFLHMKNVLFQAVEVQLECAANQKADQVYLNTLASKLREEERVKLHLQNIDYIPPTIPKSIPKGPKLSKDDKIAADYARIMNIPIETARRLINNKLKEVTGFTCTCKETPGLCKIHVK
jgi:ribosomal protein L37AE/L43A